MGIPPPLESYRWLCHVYAALHVEMWTRKSRRLRTYKPAAETPLVCQCDYDWFYKSNEVTRVGAMLVTVVWLLNYKSNALHYSVTDKSNIITVTRYTQLWVSDRCKGYFQSLWEHLVCVLVQRGWFSLSTVSIWNTMWSTLSLLYNYLSKLYWCLNGRYIISTLSTPINTMIA